MDYKPIPNLIIYPGLLTPSSGLLVPNLVSPFRPQADWLKGGDFCVKKIVHFWTKILQLFGKVQWFQALGSQQLTIVRKFTTLEWCSIWTTFLEWKLVIWCPPIFGGLSILKMPSFQHVSRFLPAQNMSHDVSLTPLVRYKNFLQESTTLASWAELSFTEIRSNSMAVSKWHWSPSMFSWLPKWRLLNRNTLPETNSQAPKTRASQKERIIFQPSIFRGELLVSGFLPEKKWEDSNTQPPI